MGVREIARFLEQWRMDVRDLHRRLIPAPTPRERGRWHALWLLVQGWTASAAAKALERDPHTIGRWAAVLGEGSPGALIFEQSGGSPVLGEEEQAELRAAVQELPAAVGTGLANWNWKVVHQFVLERFGISLCRSSCLNCLHRLGFVLKRPRKRLVKADDGQMGGLRGAAPDRHSPSHGCLALHRAVGSGTGWGLPERPPPALRPRISALRRRQGSCHGFELPQQLLVAPVSFGQPFAIQVYQLTEALHLGLKGEVLCTGVAPGVLTGYRDVPVGVSNGISRDVFTGVFDDIIHEDPDGVPKAVLLCLSDQFTPPDHPI